MGTAIIILAAGKGTRMRSDLPKVLHKLAGVPLLWHAMRAGELIAAERTLVVVGHGGAEVQASAEAQNEDAIVVEQTEQLGTAHAVQQAEAALSDFEGDAIVLYGDTPFIAPATLEDMLALRQAGTDVVVLGFEARDPGRYGRLMVEDGALMEIVEAKDATPEQLAINLCNSGVVCADGSVLFELLRAVTNDNAAGEYYLPDIVAIARGKGMKAGVVICEEEETLGVNSRGDLAAAEAVFQSAARKLAMEEGVTLYQPESVYFAYDTIIGRDVTVGPNVVFGPEVTVETGAEINAFCHLEGCHVSAGAKVGPFARLRPGAELGPDARVGNFVEIKAATLGAGAKVNHLSYIGDASVGEAANIGAGTITCNYDGVFKHRTEIGARAFVGSNSALVAPVTVGEDALIGSGAVITTDVPAGDLALARARQENKTGLGLRMMQRLRALKAKRAD
ncbi:bifunctional UDP-N-acetylglucosamine diphosphorylase/glucosamine-1-phosphate N-acetyltransferase GlmU [Algicella marina]|uniref:Bifunctional protein GlmU n=1 Tax=Algicella marina TaxID=2683284 RepID=A0A6P1T0B9_9RHOB|nr:bifunctional UDP-N-acetylglucosamine diphosphorylase/glucosamine-1-phosphate N-acetyltransferase GlmU [Algicella marina]QHQ35300.1 bifunctional UDP-N-acetylglucosamine diphosphorylase/glucosamine-1-phosphate N-acetyltransferase GlmU [Algicella marina]